MVLSYSFWRSYFDGDRTIVGRTIALNGHAMTVIGVAQPGFDGVELGAPAKVFVPIMMKTEMTPHSDGLKDRRRRLSWVTAYGRLKPGVGLEQAQLSLQPLMHGILEMEVQQPEFTRSATASDRQLFLRNRVELLPGSDNGLREYMRRPLWLLVALTGAVLLLACANLANLLLARATAREREFAVRLAIGAGRARIVRQLLIESLLLSAAGAVVGLALAFLADRILLRIYLPADAAAEFVVSPIPDGRVLAFVVGAMLLTSLVFGLLPAVRGSRTEITLSLKDRSGALSAGGISLRRMLVGVQVALSLLLLVGAGLFVRTLRNLESLGPGFPTDHLLTFTIDPSLNGYSDEETKSFYATAERQPANHARCYVGWILHHAAPEGLCMAECDSGQGFRRSADRTTAGSQPGRPGLLCYARYSYRRRACLHRAGRGAEPNTRSSMRALPRNISRAEIRSGSASGSWTTCSQSARTLKSSG